MLGEALSQIQLKTTHKVGYQIRWASKVTCQVKGHCSVSGPWTLVVVCDHFFTRAGVILRQFTVHRPLTLNLTLKVECRVKDDGCVSCSVRLAIVLDLLVHVLT